METVFTEVLDMSLTASVVILVVLTARYFLRKAPKGISYALWAVVLFRLLCPVSLTAPVSVLEISQPKVTVMDGAASSVSYLPEIPPGVPVSEPELPAIQNAELAASPRNKQAGGADLQAWAAWCWMLGTAAMALHGLLSYLRLSRRLVGATPAENRVYLADYIPTPFVMGILKPKIYLPSDTPEGERPYILAHEKHHIRRLDHIFKLLAFVALCLHWFNPLVWAAFFLAGKDMEMSCDEAVIRKLGPEIRADYAQSLLRLATNRRILAGIPLAFGEGDTKGRVKHMVNWKKPKNWAVIFSVLLCAAVLISCAVNPDKEENTTGEAGNTEPTEASEPAAETTETGSAVTIGLHIPFDVTAVESESGVWQFFLVEPIPGQISNQAVTTELLGGVRVYDTPDMDLQDMSAWLQAVGVPQIVNGGYDYMASSSESADLEVSFADAGGRETKHYYFIQGESVFELWFDTARLDNMTQAAILESVYFAPDATIERSLPVLQESEAMQDMADRAEAREEANYLERCRAALEEIQNREQYTLKIQRNNYGGPIINETGSSWYYQSGEDWLLVHYIPDEAFERGFGQFGYLYVDGVYLNNDPNDTRTGWDENEDIVWGKAETAVDTGIKPWLANFQWDAQDVLYVTKMPAGKGLCFTLQVMAPYSRSEEAYDHYQVQLVFDENAELVRIENTVFFHHETEGDYSTKETFQIIDYEANLAIQQEYQRYLSTQ